MTASIPHNDPFLIHESTRIVPVHLDDRPLLGMLWQDCLYIDPVLRFGLRAALKLFNVIADALETWIARHWGVEFLWHYLDDFITIGCPNLEECHFHLHVLCETCRRLGIPLTSEKVEGLSRQKWSWVKIGPAEPIFTAKMVLTCQKQSLARTIRIARP